MNFRFLLTNKNNGIFLNAELKIKKEELASLQKEANRNYKEWTNQKLEVTKGRNLIGGYSTPPRQFQMAGKVCESLRRVACWRKEHPETNPHTKSK